jgi:ribosomal protein S14
VSGATIVVRASFDRPRAVRHVEESEVTGRPPGVARLLGLAHQIETKIQSGELRGYAHAAEVLGVSRARVSQITALALLASAIQEDILSLAGGHDSITERQLRVIVAEPQWEAQMRLWRLVRRQG